MKKLLMITVLAILGTTLLHSQNLFQIPTQYSRIDSTLIINTSVFRLNNPVKVRFNDSNAVLINEANMDSINLKYLNSNLLYSQNQSFQARIDLLVKELDKSNFTNTHLETDNKSLKLLNKNNETYIANQDKIHDNEILYWQERAKGKFRAFLLGTSVGALIITVLTFVL